MLNNTTNENDTVVYKKMKKGTQLFVVALVVEGDQNAGKDMRSTLEKLEHPAILSITVT